MMENEIDQVDTFQDRVQRAIIDSTKALEVREAGQTRITTSPATSTIPTSTGTSITVTDSSSAPVVLTVSTVSTSAPTTTTVSSIDPF